MEEQLTKVLQDGFGLTWEDATPVAVYAALHRYTQQQMEAMPPCKGKKKLYYVSAEFLMGKLLSNNLINLRLFDEAKAVLKSHGFSLEEMLETIFEKLKAHPELVLGPIPKNRRKLYALLSVFFFLLPFVVAGSMALYGFANGISVYGDWWMVILFLGSAFLGTHFYWKAQK